MSTDTKGLGTSADSYALWNKAADAKPRPLTREDLERGMKSALRYREPFEVHDPRCTLIQGEDWCSCGTRPFDRILKAELDRAARPTKKPRGKK